MTAGIQPTSWTPRRTRRVWRTCVKRRPPAGATPMPWCPRPSCSSSRPMTTNSRSRHWAIDDARLTGLLLSADAWRDAGLKHPLGEHARGFVDHDPARVTRDILDAVPPELVARHVLFGTPSRIADQLDALRLAGLRHANLSFGPLNDDASTRAVCAVVDAVRRQGGIT